jgi:hypothetical protein
VPDAVSRTLTAIADITVTLRETAWWWRRQLGAPAGDCVLRIRRERGSGDDPATPHEAGAGLNVTWYAEVDADDGRTLTGALEAWFDGAGEWLVESTVTATGEGSFEVLLPVGSTTVTDADLLAGVLLDHARQLDAARAEALAAFRSRWPGGGVSTA